MSKLGKDLINALKEAKRKDLAALQTSSQIEQKDFEQIILELQSKISGRLKNEIATFKKDFQFYRNYDLKKI